MRLGTFAKSIAPGMRVGFVTADAATISRFAEGGMLDSGGGASHFAGLVVAEYMRSGDYARVVDRLRDAFRERRDEMLQALAAEMPPGTTWTEPAGGYFIWVDLPPGLDAQALLPLAEARGTSMLPGPTFFLDRNRRSGLAAGSPSAATPLPPWARRWRGWRPPCAPLALTSACYPRLPITPDMTGGSS